MRVLFSSRPAYGHVYPLLPLAVACRAAGHDVLGPLPDSVPVERFVAQAVLMPHRRLLPEEITGDAAAEALRALLTEPGPRAARARPGCRDRGHAGPGRGGRSARACPERLTPSRRWRGPVLGP